MLEIRQSYWISLPECKQSSSLTDIRNLNIVFDRLFNHLVDFRQRIHILLHSYSQLQATVGRRANKNTNLMYSK